ncbi:hypothetical protein V5F77_12145 [Xanthobacter sp. DSM 24535]|uniref:hypothetical protein n=1 Tax=Roseixanthobacter psychrophilus TaxID=3119917 RepID=UPI003728DD20
MLEPPITQQDWIDSNFTDLVRIMIHARLAKNSAELAISSAEFPERTPNLLFSAAFFPPGADPAAIAANRSQPAA